MRLKGFVFLVKKGLYYKVWTRLPFFRVRAKFWGRNDIRQAVASRISNGPNSAGFDAIPTMQTASEVQSQTPGTQIDVLGQLCELNAALFHVAFDDFEKTMYVHRFLWLNQMGSVNQDTSQLLSELIINYAAVSDFKHEGLTHETYTVCERLINWSLFFSKYKSGLSLNKAQKDKLNQYVYDQSELIQDHLEYHGPYTNNHILNNGRALYITGTLWDMPQTKAIGEKIIRKELDKYLPEGIYIENSSHYQAMYSKNMLEVLWAAHKGDDSNFSDWLEKRIPKMVQTARLLQSVNERSETMPLFGDISPDIHPTKLVGWPFADRQKHCSWARQFDEIANTIALNPTVVYENGNAQNSWFKLTEGHFEVWVILKNKGVQCHGHNDNGSLVVFYKGKPVISDLGRVNYHNIGQFLPQVSEEGHNTVSMAGLSADFQRDQLLFGNDVIVSTYELVKSSKNALEFCLFDHSRKYVIKRNIDLTSAGFSVTDQVMKASVDSALISRYHFPGQPNELLDSMGLMYKTSHSSTVNMKENQLVSASYGEEGQAVRMELRTEEKKNQLIIRKPN